MGNVDRAEAFEQKRKTPFILTNSVDNQFRPLDLKYAGMDCCYRKMGNLEIPIAKTNIRFHSHVYKIDYFIV